MGESTWTPTPISESVATLQKLIAGYCLLPDDDEARETALAGMRRAIDRLNTRQWNWALTYDDIPFVADQTDYALTSWFKAPRNFELWNSSNQSVSRLAYKPWKDFLMEHQDQTTESEPYVYSCANVNSLGSLTLNCVPSAAWVSKYPGGRVWYFRRVQYPNSPGETLDVPSEVVAYVQSYAEGFTADRYAAAKAATAYARARETFHELVVDDCHGQQSDWS